MKKSTFGALALGCILSFATVPVLSQSGGPNCLSGPEIQAAIADGTIKPLDQILQMAGIVPGVKVLQPVAVCERQGEPYYLLNLLGADGDARKVVLHAVTGAS